MPAGCGTVLVTSFEGTAGGTFFESGATSVTVSPKTPMNAAVLVPAPMMVLRLEGTSWTKTPGEEKGIADTPWLLESVRRFQVHASHGPLHELHVFSRERLDRCREDVAQR